MKARIATALFIIASTAVARAQTLDLSCTVASETMNEVLQRACAQYCRTDVAIDVQHGRARVGDPIWANWVRATVTSSDVTWQEPGYVDDSGTYGTQYYRFDRSSAALSESNTFRLGTWYNRGPGGSSETDWRCTVSSNR